MSKDYDVYGPGHNCFTVSGDGQEDLIIYHAARWMIAGWSRSIRFGYVNFNENGGYRRFPFKCPFRDLLKCRSQKGHLKSKKLQNDIFRNKQQCQYIHQGTNLFLFCFASNQVQRYIRDHSHGNSF